jgi:signal transduction histidine kinase
VTVDGDQALLGAMVRNLIDNALRHGGDPARITVHVDGGSQHARITVDDEGPGLAPDALERIGRRFERLDAPADYGVGLGLALVARIARWHGGDFRIFSREGRPGTRAEVTLPVQAARADTGAA